MAKDPAFLFYPGDWQGGTQTLSRFIKGCYLDILVAQFNNGPLSLEEIKTVLGSDFGTSWPTLQKKFKKSAEGLFFNERLASEQKKRTEHSEQQRKRIQDYWNRKKNVLEDSTVYTGIDTKKVPLENRDENENRNEVKIGGVGERGWVCDLPFKSMDFSSKWIEWRDYCKSIKKPYQTFSSEQAALTFIGKYDESTALEMINQAMRNSWKNLREIETTNKEKINGNATTKKVTPGGFGVL